jgi:hypothetical protein
MLSRNALAEHWQVSPQAISKLRKRGCPMTSLANADAWRSRNISTRSKGNGAKAAPIPNKLTAEDAEVESMMAAEGRLHRPTVEKNLRLLEQLTEQGRAALADAIDRGESENARRWTITILNLVARSAIVAKSLQELLEHDEVVVRTPVEFSRATSEKIPVAVSPCFRATHLLNTGRSHRRPLASCESAVAP